MRVVYERCCGLDVHKKTVVACVLITETSGETQRRMARGCTASWIAASASFFPPAPIREMRDLVRYRKTLVQERARSE